MPATNEHPTVDVAAVHGHPLGADPGRHEPSAPGDEEAVAVDDDASPANATVRLQPENVNPNGRVGTRLRPVEIPSHAANLSRVPEA